ncbi:MAG: T9SS type A sorting domain-containing protein [Flavobacteriales bacterium]|nr:T9SS type A sorting domain-containing protein [Flavobacteriales bacterium]
MKKIYGVLIASMLSQALTAQITYTSASFPVEGETLLVTSTTDASITVKPASDEAQHWDFSNIAKGVERVDTIKAASESVNSDMFSDADLLTPIVGLGNNFTVVSSTEIVNIGGELDFMGLEMVAAYGDPNKVQEAPITYGDGFTDDYELYFGDKIDSIPGMRDVFDAIAEDIPADSMRIKMSGTTMKEVDAFGTLLAHDNETYDVIRQKSTVYSSFAIEFSLDFFGYITWVDLSTIMELPIPSEDTIITYSFLADTYKQPIVELIMNPEDNAVASVEYMGQNVVSVNNLSNNNASVYPNPVEHELSVSSVSNINSVSVYNALGTLMQSNQNVNSKNINIDASSLQNGVYVVKIVGENGTSTKKITVNH